MEAKSREALQQLVGSLAVPEERREVIASELADHLESCADDLVAAGFARTEAEARVLRALTENERLRVELEEVDKRFLLTADQARRFAIAQLLPLVAAVPLVQMAGAFPYSPWIPAALAAAGLSAGWPGRLTERFAFLMLLDDREGDLRIRWRVSAPFLGILATVTAPLILSFLFELCELPLSVVGPVTTLGLIELLVLVLVLWRACRLHIRSGQARSRIYRSFFA